MPTAVRTGGLDMGSPYRYKASAYSSHTLLLESLPARGNSLRVLDVGCAGGYLSELLARRGYRVTGVESAVHAVQNFPETVELVHADLDSGLPPGLGSFDYVICADVLEHLRRPEPFLRELHSVLTANGRLVASLPNSGHWYFRWNVLMGRFPQHDRGLFDRTHLHFYTWQGWVQLFAAAGFTIEQARSSGIPAGEALPRWRDRWPVRLAERISFESGRIWKTACAYQFIVVARPEEGR